MKGSVFVYGTLKPGEYNFHLAEKLGLTGVREAYLNGMKLYNLSPENYPAMVKGHGRVWGCLLDFAAIARALPRLDELEGADETPPLYRRVRVVALPVHAPAWTYLHARPERFTEPGARRFEGSWHGSGEPSRRARDL